MDPRTSLNARILALLTRLATSRDGASAIYYAFTTRTDPSEAIGDLLHAERRWLR